MDLGVTKVSQGNLTETEFMMFVNSLMLAKQIWKIIFLKNFTTIVADSKYKLFYDMSQTNLKST